MRFVLLLTTVVVLAANAQFGGMQNSPPVIPTGVDTAPPVAEAGIHPWLAMSGLYRRDLDGVTPGEAAGQFYPSFSGGLSGWKNWNRRNFSASYAGSATHRSREFTSVSWTQSHVATLAYEQQATQHLSYAVSQFGGITYGGYGYGSAFSLNGVPGSTPGAATDPGASGLPNSSNNGLVDGELIDSKIKFSSTEGNVNYRVNQRMMISGFGGAALMRRSSKQFSQDNFLGGGSIGYLTSERMQVGGDYSYGAYRYPNSFGGIVTHTAMFSGRYQMTQTAVISAGAGVGEMSSEFIGQVAIDPDLAAILGTGTILQVTKTSFVIPSYRFEFLKTLEKGSFFAGAARGFNGGNGVVLAGVRDSVTSGYTRILSPRIGLSGVASYQRLSGRVATISTTVSAQGIAVLSVRMFGSVSFTSQAGMRYISVTGSPRRREVLAGFGLAWMPGGNPFTF